MTTSTHSAFGRPRPTTQIAKRFLGFWTPARTPDKFTGQMYQLRAQTALPKGAYVVIDGPHDTFGVVLSAAYKEDAMYGEHFLHQIRGIRRQGEFRPVLHWQG